MKIFIPVLGFGNTGGYRVLSELANGLIRKGYDVVFVTSSHNKTPYFPTVATIITYKCNLAKLKSKHYLSSVSSLRLIPTR